MQHSDRRKNEWFSILIYARADVFYQNIMRGPMVFIFLYARLQSRSLRPETIARNNNKEIDINRKVSGGQPPAAGADLVFIVFYYVFKYLRFLHGFLIVFQ